MDENLALEAKRDQELINDLLKIERANKILSPACHKVIHKQIEIFMQRLELKQFKVHFDEK